MTDQAAIASTNPSTEADSVEDSTPSNTRRVRRVIVEPKAITGSFLDFTLTVNDNVPNVIPVRLHLVDAPEAYIAQAVMLALTVRFQRAAASVKADGTSADILAAVEKELASHLAYNFPTPPVSKPNLPQIVQAWIMATGEDLEDVKVLRAYKTAWDGFTSEQKEEIYNHPDVVRKTLELKEQSIAGGEVTSAVPTVVVA